MRVLIDLQGAQSQSKHRGIGKYSLSFSLAFAKQAKEHDIWILLNDAFHQTIPVIKKKFARLVAENKIRVFTYPKPVNGFAQNRIRLRIAERLRELAIQAVNPDIVIHTTTFENHNDSSVISINSGKRHWKTISILYDLIPLENQKKYLCSREAAVYYFSRLSHFKRSDLIWGISNYSCNIAIEKIGFKSEMVTNISGATDIESYGESDIQLDQYLKSKGLFRKILFYAPGGFDDRKNVLRLIKAYSLLETKIKEEYQLVISSKVPRKMRHRFRRQIRKCYLESSDVVFTGYLRQRELVLLYRASSLFVYPSLSEGFGLPILEAMSFGVPVIGSNITSIPEVIGDSNLLFDPYSAKSIAEKISSVLLDNQLKKMSEYSMNQSKKFSWYESSRKAIESMNTFSQTNNANLPDRIEKSLLNDQFARSLNGFSHEMKRNGLALLVSHAAVFNQALLVRKQLLVDVSVIVFVDAKSGIQRVVRNILKNILEMKELDYDVRPIYFDGKNYRYANIFSNQFCGKPLFPEHDHIVVAKQDDSYLAVDLTAHLTDRLHEVHRYWRNIGIKMNYIVYDLLLVQNPQWWPPANAFVFKQWLQSITEVASGMLCISQAVADELKEWGKNKHIENLESRVKSFHLGADIENKKASVGMPEDADSIMKIIRENKSFLMVGTLEPRKGHSQVIKAFDNLWSEDIDVVLVIVGKAGWFVDDLIDSIQNHREFGKRLIWLEGISDEYLLKIYEFSTCLIAASLGEGFGLPLIEAAKNKIPIIARDLKVFQEVAGQCAYYFSGTRPSNLSEAIQDWLRSYNEGTYPKSEGLSYLTWKESVDQLLDLIAVQ